MKKILASFGFIAAFAGYALYQNSAEAAPAISVPTSDASNSAGTVADANAPTQTQTDSAAQTSTSQTSPQTQQTQPAQTTPTPTPTPQPKASSGRYTDGTYTGAVANAYYGYVQVQATISGGRIANVQFLRYPNDRSTSRMINSQAMPYLSQEAISAQSANVDIVSGATDTSQAFRQSLASALAQA